MTARVESGKEYIVALYIDKSNRLAATMKVYPYLKLAGDYEKDDEVSGIVYEIHPDFGAYVAIDNEYQGMILKNEVHDTLKVGDIVNCRVVKVREDGKINLSPNKKHIYKWTRTQKKLFL